MWPNSDKLKVLSRSYPQAVAGAVEEYSFNSETGRFVMTYSLLSTLPASSLSFAATTEVFVNRELFYKQGLKVKVTGDQASLLEVRCPVHGENVVQLVQKGDASDSGLSPSVRVTIDKCFSLLGETCTC